MTETFIPAENSLRTFFEHLFDKSIVGLAIIGIDGTVLRVNDRYCQILGYAARELVHKSYKNYSTEMDVQGDELTVAEFLDQSRSEFKMVKTYIRKDRVLIDCELTSRPVWVGDKCSFFLSQIDPLPLLAKHTSDPEIKMAVKGFKYIFIKRWHYTWPIIVSIATAIGFHLNKVIECEAKIDSYGIIIHNQQSLIDQKDKIIDNLQERLRRATR